MPEVKLLAVIVAAIAGFMVGGVWYSPMLFAKAWMAENRFVLDEVKDKFDPAKTYGLTLLFAVIAAYTFAMFLGTGLGWQKGAMYGFTAGLGWVGMSFATSYLYEMKTLRHWAINAGYHTVQFTVMGAILGAMN